MIRLEKTTTTMNAEICMFWGGGGIKLYRWPFSPERGKKKKKRFELHGRLLCTSRDVYPAWYSPVLFPRFCLCVCDPDHEYPVLPNAGCLLGERGRKAGKARDSCGRGRVKCLSMRVDWVGVGVCPSDGWVSSR